MFLNVSGSLLWLLFGLNTRLINEIIESRIKLLYVFSDRLFHAEESLYGGNVYTGNETGMCEVAFLLLGLFGQDVALERVFSFDFS